VLHASCLLAALALSSPAPQPRAPERLALRELFVTEHGRTRLSPRVEGLTGQRVRVTGYMVQMEDPPEGAFYLAGHPVFQDESGGGTGDIPPESLRVRVREVEGAQVPFTPKLVEVVGTLEVGREEDAEGRVSLVRLVLEEPIPPAGNQRAPAEAASATPPGTQAQHRR
jgi:hypothetical protein